MGEDTAAKPEQQGKEFWTMDKIKAKLLEGSRNQLTPESNFPELALLNEVWMNLLEEIYYQSETVQNGRATFYFEHAEENARIVKTNNTKSAILVQKRNIQGSNTHVTVNSSSVRAPEVFVGVLHKHPVEALFSSEDILHMIAKDGQLLAGIVTPAHYYLAFRSSDSINLSSNEAVNRGYLLAMAKKHNAPTSITPPNNTVGFAMTPEMLKELKIPTFQGTRGQLKLSRI